MAGRSRIKRVDKTQASRYAETGRVFLESARALSVVADAGAPYGNATGLLAIHASIGYTDCLSIAFAGIKSTGEHTSAADNLQEVLGARLPISMGKVLRKILMAKDDISYQGHFYPLSEGRKLLKLAEAYCEWAGDLFQRRP